MKLIERLKAKSGPPKGAPVTQVPESPLKGTAMDQHWIKLLGLPETTFDFKVEYGVNQPTVVHCSYYVHQLPPACKLVAGKTLTNHETFTVPFDKLGPLVIK